MAEDKAGPVIQARALVKHYGAVRAVDGIDLTVESGDIYALLGLNGAGKTTTIRMLLGMIAPKAGQVRLFGQPITGNAEHVWAQTGYLVETPAAYPELTVHENLRLVARLKGLGGHAAGEAMQRLGLQPYAKRRARHLSLGNQQRLGLAKALLGQPRLLILDEPANGLDPAGVTEVRQLLKDLAAAGAAILLSSHILAEVAKVATRVAIIHEGRMVTEVAAADLPQRVRRQLQIACHDNHGAVLALQQAGYVATTAINGMLMLDDQQAVALPDRVATLLVNAGCPPLHLAVHEEDLETLFLRLTRQEP